jgi:hypothetical protein
MNYYEKLGKLYHELGMNEHKFNITERKPGGSFKHSVKQMEIKIKMEKLINKELNNNLIATNIRPMWFKEINVSKRIK